MKIIPLASESLGVRSLSVFIETRDIKILLDAGVSLATRYGLLPHPLEYQALKEARERIREYAKKADVITLSHYHFDHYTQTYDEIEPRFTWSSIEEAEEIYSNKHILAKSINNKINYSQKKRGYIFSKTIKRFTDRLEFVDDTKLEFGSTVIEVSKPLPHGEDNTPLGYVLVYTIDDGYKLVYASDTQLLSKNSLEYIKSKNADMIITSAVPTYLKRLDDNVRKQGLENLKEMAKRCKMIRYPPSNHFLQWTKNPSSLPPL